jgi:hypothetical protein
VTHHPGLRRALTARGARGAAVLDVARRRIVEQAGETTPALLMPARREALCRSLEAQQQAAAALGGEPLRECLLVLDGSYLVLHMMAGEEGYFLCTWLDAQKGNLGLALRLLAEAAALPGPGQGA